jgi:hypothetical protein
MLVAEINGKYVLDARNFEDYLTSAVFGHLRYIKPGAFWDALFDIAEPQPIESTAITAKERIRRETGSSLGSFGALDALFWPKHKEGIPDLILHFYGNQPRSVVILIEAKLYAAKSSNGEHDQLAKYLRILDSLQDLSPPLPSDALALAVYLTATDSRSEIIKSLNQYGDCEQARQRLFHLQWQDVIRAIDSTTPASELEGLILDDVRRFLRKRDLEYFSGMESAAKIPSVLEVDGEFLKDELLFDVDSIPTGLDIN